MEQLHNKPTTDSNRGGKDCFSGGFFGDGYAGSGGSQMRNLVSAQDRVPADLQHLKKHLDTVFDRVDFGTFIVGPLYRDLGDAKSEAPGKEKEFWVESPTFDALAGKDGVGGGAGKGLESALRVFLLQVEDDSQ